MDIQNLLIPLRGPPPSKGELLTKPLETSFWVSASQSHLKNDVLLQYQGPFQLGSDRDEALRNLLSVLVCMLASVRKGNDGTVNRSNFPSRSRE